MVTVVSNTTILKTPFTEVYNLTERCCHGNQIKIFLDYILLECLFLYLKIPTINCDQNLIQGI